MEPKPFIELLRRTQKSKFKSVLMHNRMMMQCYSVDIDSDIGLHYILHIPNNELYADPFYDETLLLVPADILEVYNNGHAVLLEKKKEVSAKPKEVREEMTFSISKNVAKIKFHFIVRDELLTTTTYTTPYPVNPNDNEVETIVDCYQQMLNRIKIGGCAIALDAVREGIFHLANESVQIVYYKVKLGGVTVRVPLYKTMLLGAKAVDEFFISVQETSISSIYLYTIQMARKGLVEQFIGYILNF